VQVSSMVSGFTIASIHFLLFCAAPGLTRLQTAQIYSFLCKLLQEIQNLLETLLA
jgi:hypothetical protein